MVRSLRNGSGSTLAQQRGAAMLLTLVLLGLLIAIFVVVLTNDLVRQNSRQRQTAEALAKAKEALVGFAVGGDIGAACGSSWDCRRPGELPCPDLDDDGSSDACTAQDDRLGRLPWRTLDLPDLRDGDGERLWYAVSNKYKNSPRTQCSNPTQAGCLNSESPGTILLSDKDGTVVNDGSDPNPPSGVIAVVISPGAVLQREGAGSAQDRTCAGGSCIPANDPTGKCFTALPATKASQTAKCNPVNYLDVVSGGEDNADFIDGDPFNGFMNGPVYTGNRRQIVNDTVLAVGYDDIMPLVEKRVAKEVMNCLTAFGAANEGRYPWASSMVNSSGSASYADTPRYRFGRLPDTFDSTLLGTEINVLTISLGNLLCALLPGLCNKPNWPATASCSIRSDGWWTNWKDQVFYGVGEGFRPDVNVIALNLLPPLINLDLLPSSGTACTDDVDNCLRVDPPSAAVDKRVVVIVAGRPLAGAGQPQKPTSRTRSNAAHYLEGANPGNSPTSGSFLIFEQQTRSATFNDTVVFQ